MAWRDEFKAALELLALVVLLMAISLVLSTGIIYLIWYT